MSRPVVTAREDESLGHVTHRLVTKDLTRLPVVDADGRLAGMISRLDVLRSVVGRRGEPAEQEPPPRAGKTVGEIMSPNVPTVHVNDALAEVLRQILSASIRRVIVLDEQDRPIGVITDGDVVARVGSEARGSILQALAARVVGAELRPDDVSARELMSQNVLAAPAETSIIDAIDLLLREGRKRLVVVGDDGRPIGMVDRQMLLAASLGM